MSKQVLIVENDSNLSHAMRDKLSARGFDVEETNDGKGSAELIRKTKPDLVVLAVDFAAGQNGYIICKKLKSDDELKAIPVIIVGNPDGFAAHRKLKTHADDYLGKPFDPSTIVDRAGALIGFPEPTTPEVVQDDSLNLSELLDEDTAADKDAPPPVTDETVGSADPDFEMVDSVFDDVKTGATDAPATSDHEELRSEEYQLEERTMIGEAPAPPPPPAAATSGRSDGEMRELKTKVAELTGSLEAAHSRTEELEAKVRELEQDLENRTTELETAKSTSSAGKSDNKEVFALKEQANKKDKEILRLKTELNDKEKEVIELHEKENTLEQQLSESGGEMAKKDAQLKTATAKADQLSNERKKIDQQLMTAREEARSSTAKLTTVEAELEELQGKNETLQMDIATLRTEKDEAESAKREASGRAKELDDELAQAKLDLEAKTTEAEEARSANEQAQIDLDSAKNQLTAQATSFADEIGGLRRRITELEESAAKHEERVKALFARVKSEEALREKVKTALADATQMLEEQAPQSDLDLSEDELAEA
ncbi:MAG: response regulator [Myxococcaceae bacterium]